MRVFFVDTDSELIYSDVDKFGLELIKMPYILDGVEYYDDAGRNINYDDFFEQLKVGKSCKTAALNTQNYLDLFEPHFAAGNEIFYLHFSSEMSATFEFMNTAISQLKEKYPKVSFRTFDTKSISIGAGIQCYYAGKMYKEGKSFDEIIKFLEGFSSKAACFFVVDDLDFLKKGGRITGMAAFAGKLLGIKPVLHVNDEGKIVKYDTVRGKSKVVDYLVNLVVENRIDNNEYGVWVAYTADSVDIAKTIVSKLKVLYPCAEITGQQIGPVVGTHCGPGTSGVIFYSKIR